MVGIARSETARSETDRIPTAAQNATSRTLSLGPVRHAMADEDAGRAVPDEDVGRATPDGDAGRPRPSEPEDGTGFSFSIPPIELPEMKFPERIRLAFPIPEPPEKVSKPTRVRVSWVLLAVLVADALDALAVALVGPTILPWARAAVGTLVSILLAGPLGLLYPWELLAILGGVGWLSVAPTLTLLALVRIAFSE
jgi:hypothetical protein